MAQDQQVINAVEGTWTQLTNSDVTSITFQVLDKPVYIRGTVGATAPSDTVYSGLVYGPHQGELQKTLTEMFSASGVNRVYARVVKGFGGGSGIMVDHA